jgi:hypothetical protein
MARQMRRPVWFSLLLLGGEVLAILLTDTHAKGGTRSDADAESGSIERYILEHFGR